MEGLAADDPLKTLDYVNRSFKSCKSKHPYINNQIIRSCLAYQYLLKVYLNLNIGIWDILEENSLEIGLIGPGNTLLTQILDRLFGWSKIFCLHACMHDAYGRIRTMYNVGRGYLYIATGKSYTFPLYDQIGGLIWAFKNYKFTKNW